MANSTNEPKCFEIQGNSQNFM